MTRGIRPIPIKVAITPIPIGTSSVKPLLIEVVIGSNKSAVITKVAIKPPNIKIS